MGDTKSARQASAGCCAGGAEQEAPESSGPAANCVCAPTNARRSWVRTLIAAVILLAAIGVGAYSLISGGSQEGGGTAVGNSGSLPAGAASVPELPTDPARPACCGGASVAPSSETPCCGRAGASGQATLPTGEASCGSPSKGCCGH